MESDYPANEGMFTCEFDESRAAKPQPSSNPKQPGGQGPS